MTVHEKHENFDDDLVTVVFKTQHVHAGKIYKAGETLRVNAAMKTWLIERGVVMPIEKDILTLSED
jgi:starvation-inducible outer membrane lipoprotein